MKMCSGYCLWGFFFNCVEFGSHVWEIFSLRSIFFQPLNYFVFLSSCISGFHCLIDVRWKRLTIQPFKFVIFFLFSGCFSDQLFFVFGILKFHMMCMHAFLFSLPETDVISCPWGLLPFWFWLIRRHHVFKYSCWLSLSLSCLSNVR